MPEVLCAKPLSVVLSLGALDHVKKCDYVDRLLPALLNARIRSGIPHWTFVDEAHYFFDEHSPHVRHLQDRTGSTLLLTYRPSQLAAALHRAVETYLVTSTEVDEERYLVSSLIAESGLGSCAPDLETIEPPLVGLLRRGHEPCWTLFTPGVRATPHVHHERKYLDERLPPGKEFVFRLTPVPLVAHNAREFCTAVTALPLASLRHHLVAGDFSRWAADVLGDPPLAAGLRKIEQTARTNGRVNPLEVVRHVRSRYAV